MTSPEDTDTDTDADDNNDNNDNNEGAPMAVIYVYGIVPADVQPEDDATGIHDAPIEIVTHGDIAASWMPVASASGCTSAGTMPYT